MKRVKIMFSTIAIVAIVSGSVAFKAAKDLGNRYCSTSANVTAPNQANFNENTGGNLDRFCTTIPGSSGGVTGTSTIKVFEVGE